ncbi:MAG: aminomethyl-transferring glycine dehydrogenase subunit GcvPA [Gammaproteobacteria bacterium]|nr:aminomethyl-transferring glycine dehydrogenase subunit GcvPA [Gammaproteobacteria bacterium]
MPFVPHTDEDEKVMLDTIGVNSIEDLFDEIPGELRAGELLQIPDGISEMELLRLMNERARRDEVVLSFLGAGAYEHHIPGVVWDLTSRGEFLTAYTPYQAEASQGLLQLIYEYQTMISRLTAMDVANASVYDGASAMAEAMLMAVRANRKSKSKKILCAGNVHPGYLAACRSIVRNQQISIDIIDWDVDTGNLDTNYLQSGEDYAALVISYPNFFGGLEDVNHLTDWAHQEQALVVAVVNPISLGLLNPPGNWGDDGADIVVSEGQPLGIPVSSGGPYLGIMCCRQAIVRQMPGRIIGRTTDLDGKEGFTLTLQAREQHIRRAKATSNICTNQGLLVTAATIYMSLMGDKGIYEVARQCHHGLLTLLEKARRLPGVEPRFHGPRFHEVVLKLPVTAKKVLAGMAEQGILGGYDLGGFSENLENCVLVNVTETKTIEDIEKFVACLATVLEV